MKIVLISLLFVALANIAYSQKFMLKLDKDMKPLLDSVAFEIRTATLKYGLMDFVIMNKQLSHSNQNMPIYIYVTGSYPRIDGDTMVWMLSETEAVKGLWMLVIGYPKLDNTEGMREEKKFFGYMRSN